MNALSDMRRSAIVFAIASSAVCNRARPRPRPRSPLLLIERTARRRGAGILPVPRGLITDLQLRRFDGHAAAVAGGEEEVHHARGQERPFHGPRRPAGVDELLDAA